MPGLNDDNELREKILTLGVCCGPHDEPHRCSSMHCDHCGICDISEELIALIHQRDEARDLDIRIEEREHEWKLVNDIRYQNVSLDFAKEVSLERLTKVQVDKDMLGTNPEKSSNE